MGEPHIKCAPGCLMSTGETADCVSDLLSPPAVENLAAVKVEPLPVFSSEDVQEAGTGIVKEEYEFEVSDLLSPPAVENLAAVKVEPLPVFSSEDVQEAGTGIVKEEYEFEDLSVHPPTDHQVMVKDDPKPLISTYEEELDQEAVKEPSADVKDEIFIEEHTVGQMGPCFKGGNMVEKIAVFTKGPVHSCDGCSKLSTTRITPDSHLPNNTGEQRMCKCTISQQYIPETDLLTHSTLRRDCCNLCCSRFCKKSHLNTHMLTHSGERSHCCNICNGTFSQKSHLSTHLLTHSAERPFNCNICKRSFSRNSEFGRHMLSHSEKRRFYCNICNRRFSQRYQVNRHLLSHSGERPFCCDFCSSTFSLKSQLNRHVLSHSGERPYSCSVCSSTFLRKCSLSRHLLTHVKRSS